MKHPHAIMEFISVFTQDRSYLDSMEYLEDLSRTGGAVTMCAVADALKTEGKREGILGAVEILISAKFSEDKIADMVMAQFNLSREEVYKTIQNVKENRKK